MHATLLDENFPFKPVKVKSVFDVQDENDEALILNNSLIEHVGLFGAVSEKLKPIWNSHSVDVKDDHKTGFGLLLKKKQWNMQLFLYKEPSTSNNIIFHMYSQKCVKLFAIKLF